jgi:DNA invertase Pin-like site-specific DNA recombinase
VAEREIRIVTPEKTVRMLKLKLQGYSNYRIAKELNVPQITVSRTLERIEKDWPELLKFVREVRRTGYFKSCFLRLLKEQPRDRLVRAKELLLARGKPVAPRNFSLPGYKVENGEIKVDPETIPHAVRIFKAYLNGENMAEVLRELNLPVRDVTSIIRNPIYIGKIVFRGKIYSFPNLAIIDEKLWMECQPPKTEFKRQLVGPPIFGYKKKAGRFIKDPHKAKVVERMFDLLFEGKNMSEIAREFGFNPTNVPRMLRNPKYAGKVKVGDKYVDAPFEAIITFEKWLKAQILLDSRSRNFSREKRKELMIMRRDKVLRFLLTKPDGATFSVIKQETKYPKSSLCTYLALAKRDGLAEWMKERTGTRARGKWWLTELGKQYLVKKLMLTTKKPEKAEI